MNFLIDFSFIAHPSMNELPQSITYIIPHYLTNWNEEAISSLDLNIDGINNEILRPNGCGLVQNNDVIADIELQDFRIIQSPSNTETDIDQIKDEHDFETKLLEWFESLDGITCSLKNRRVLFTAKEANELVHTTQNLYQTSSQNAHDIDSYSLRRINELRKAEGMDSWQTELANNPDPFGTNLAKFNSRLVTYSPIFGAPKMTKYSTIRRLMDNDTGTSIQLNLPWWISMTVIILSLIGIMICHVVICAAVCSTRSSKSLQSTSSRDALMPIPTATSPVSIEVIVI